MKYKGTERELDDLRLPGDEAIDFNESLALAKRDEGLWLPGPRVKKLLANRSFVALIAPPQMGKSTVLDELQKLDDRFRRVPGFTTRPVEARDKHDVMRHLPHTLETLSKLLDKKKGSDLVQYTVFETGYIYGTLLDDYTLEVNVKEVTTRALPVFQKLGFKTLLKCGLVTDAALWSQRFEAMYPLGHKERGKRLQESVQSISGLVHMEDAVLIENVPEHPEIAAAEMRAIFDGHLKPIDRRHMLDALFSAANIIKI